MKAPKNGASALDTEKSAPGGIRLAYVAVGTPPLPCWLLTLAEAYRKSDNLWFMATATSEITELERQIFELKTRLWKLRKENKSNEVTNYMFSTMDGEKSLKELFAGKNKLLLIHNMGQRCRYCTLWADGINGLLTHLESVMSIVLVSKDTPELQRRFANSRGWRIRLASHSGGDYIRDQTVKKDADNMPGAVVYELDGETILRKNSCVFGPGDLYCIMWSLLGLAGINEAEWTPQYSYWQRPARLDDGGLNILEPDYLQAPAKIKNR